MSTDEKTKNPELALALQETIRIVGVTDTARGMRVSREKLEEMIVTQEFTPEQIEKARELRLLPLEGEGS